MKYSFKEGYRNKVVPKELKMFSQLKRRETEIFKESLHSFQIIRNIFLNEPSRGSAFSKIVFELSILSTNLKSQNQYVFKT